MPIFSVIVHQPFFEISRPAGEKNRERGSCSSHRGRLSVHAENGADKFVFQTAFHVLVQAGVGTAAFVVDMIDLFQEISDLDTTVIRKTLSVKQDVAQTIKISEKTKLIDLLGASKVEIGTGQGLSLGVFHFIRVNGERFAYLASPMEIQTLRDACTKILEDMNCEKATGTRQ